MVATEPAEGAIRRGGLDEGCLKLEKKGF